MVVSKLSARFGVASGSRRSLPNQGTVKCGIHVIVPRVARPEIEVSGESPRLLF